MEYPIPEHVHSINGVSGRMFAIQEPVNGIYRGQKWISEGRKITGYGTNGVIHVNIRFDDECKNGHQTFSITADVYTAESRRQRDVAACGCLHEDIEKVFPELAYLIKWHLVSTDGPMYYLANTLYHASNRDHNKRLKGEPSSWNTVIYFGNSPISHNISSKFASFLEERRNTGDFNIIEFNHPDTTGYKYTPNYTFAGYGEKWHKCPFENRNEAEQWQTACNTGNFRIDKIVTGYSEGKERDLNAARNSAVWPDASDEVLSLPSDNLKELLIARLPGLMAEFRADMDNAGFLWETK